MGRNQHSNLSRDDYMEYSHALMQSEEWDDASECLSEAVEAYPDVRMFWANLGFCLMNLNSFGEAERVLREAIQRDNKNEYAWFNLGSLHEVTQRRAKAAKCYEACVECGGELIQDARRRFHRNESSESGFMQQILDMTDPYGILESEFRSNDFDRRRSRHGDITLHDVDSINE